MDLNDIKILGALYATRHGTPMTVSEIAALAEVSSRTVSSRMRHYAYTGLVCQKWTHLLPTWWEITEVGAMTINKPHNREYLKTREEVNK